MLAPRPRRSARQMRHPRRNRAGVQIAERLESRQLFAFAGAPVYPIVVNSPMTAADYAVYKAMASAPAPTPATPTPPAVPSTPPLTPTPAPVPTPTPTTPPSGP